MEIYVLRHGIAEIARAGGSDADRALVPEGRKKLRSVLRVAAAAGLAPSLILTSPYRRAAQTAEVASDALKYKEKVLRTRALQPGSSPEAIWEEIRVHKEEQQLLLVGHEPLLGELVGFLLGAPSLAIDFKKGALVRIDVEDSGAASRGVLRWMLVPKLTDHA